MTDPPAPARRGRGPRRTARDGPGHRDPVQGVPVGARARRAPRCPDLRGGLRLPRTRDEAAGLAVHRPARRPVRGARPRVVAGAVGGAGRPPDRADDPAPAGQRGPLARPRLRHGWRPAARPRPARCRPRRARDAEPGRGPRPRGAAHRDRRGPRGPRRPAGEEGRGTDGRDDHGLRRQLRGDQHAVRLPPARRVPHHGDRGHRRRHAHPRGPARPPGVRRSAPWSSSASTAGRGWAPSRSPSPRCRPRWSRRSRPCCGRCRWVPRGPSSAGRSAGWGCRCARSSTRTGSS